MFSNESQFILDIKWFKKNVESVTSWRTFMAITQQLCPGVIMWEGTIINNRNHCMCSQEISVIGNKYLRFWRLTYIFFIVTWDLTLWMTMLVHAGQKIRIFCACSGLHLRPPPSHLLQKLKTALREEQERITTEQPHWDYTAYILSIHCCLRWPYTILKLSCQASHQGIPYAHVN